MRRVVLSFTATLLLVVPSPLFASVGKNEIRSVVQIYENASIGSDSFPYAWGSGTLIDEKGHILTNYHVIEDVLKYPDTFFPVVCLTLSEKESPSCYNVIVTVKEYDSIFDVALLKVTWIWDPASKEFIPTDDWLTKYNVSFPYTSIDRYAVDEKVGLGDEVQILGYPGVGGANITYTKGIVSGFDNFQDGNGDPLPYQIKTDAKVNPGNSGGAAFDSNNNFIGIPTAVAGGGGNIGYIISLPIIDFVLKDVTDIGGSTQTGYSCSAYGPNAFLDADNYCYCKQGYVWNSDETQCVSPPPPVTTSPPATNQSTVVDSECGSLIKVGNQCIAPDQYCDSFIKANSFMGESGNCECKDGYKLNSSGLCVASNSEASSEQSMSTDHPLPVNGAYIATKKDTRLVSSLKGQILLQVEEHGEAWYLNPDDSMRYYMPDGTSAYSMMRSFGLGITDNDLAKIPSVSSPQDMLASTDLCSSNSLGNKLRGRILLQVEEHGEAWYIDPRKCRKIYMKDGAAAYQIMRYLGLGIANLDLEKLPSGVM